MRKFILALAITVTSGCATIGISDESLLSKAHIQSPSGVRQKFPLNIEADMDCGSYRSGNYVKTSCTNKPRLDKVVKLFGERNLKILPSKAAATPKISVKKEKMNGFLEGTTGFFNIVTLGLLPLYSYTDYIVSYEDPQRGINLTKEFTVSSYSSWFSLLMSNAGELSESEIKTRAEENLIRRVLDDAKVGR